MFSPETGGFTCPFCGSAFTEDKIKALYEQREAVEGVKGQAAEEKAAASVREAKAAAVRRLNQAQTATTARTAVRRL